MKQTTEDLIAALAREGWTDGDFRANHLGYAAELCMGREPVEARTSFIEYWRTVARITTILQKAGVVHVILKTRRNYPYCDTNVDVFVEESDSVAVQDLLCGAGWSMPSRSVLFKQRLIEREKIKLPPVEHGLVPAHLYMAVSWRYQRDVSFLDPGMIEPVALEREAPAVAAEWGSVSVPMPTRTADILLHSAEIVFENYRITLGEALYLSWLLDQVPRIERMRIYRLGIQRGAGEALRCVLAQLGGDFDPGEGDRREWPRNLAARDLLRCWGERFRAQWGRRRWVLAAEEWVGYAAFASMYRVKRRLLG